MELLHSWKIREFNSAELRLLYMNDLSVVLRLAHGVVDKVQIELSQGGEKHTDQMNAIKAFLFDRMKQCIESQDQVDYGPAPVSGQTIPTNIGLD